jgi:hypothetical protein
VQAIQKHVQDIQVPEEPIQISNLHLLKVPHQQFPQNIILGNFHEIFYEIHLFCDIAYWFIEIKLFIDILYRTVTSEDMDVFSSSSNKIAKSVVKQT